MSGYLSGLSQGLREALFSTAILLAAAVAGWIAYRLALRTLRGVVARTETDWDDILLRRSAGPGRVLVPLLVVNLVLPAVTLSPALRAGLGHLLFILLVMAVAWTTVALLRAGQDVLLSRYDLEAADNLQARKVHTQVDIVRKIATVIVAVLALSAILLHFERLREIGTGILASAGLAGLVLGFAAQRTLANLLAGFQLALTQPIRIDDVVIVEGEWGRVEEITLTYVVIRIWDLRRLVLPISYFIEQPFENWTRTSAEILGTVFLYVDYTVPVEDVRRKLGELVEASDYWDGEVWRLHVTDSREKTLELRALMSAASSPDAWELRCEVRERMVAWLQEEYPDALPRVRATLEREGDGGRAAPGQDDGAGTPDVSPSGPVPGSPG